LKSQSIEALRTSKAYSRIGEGFCFGFECKEV
jgi:hypothetical protein